MLIKSLLCLNTFKKNEEGVTAIEYGLIAAGISLAIVGIVAVFGADLVGLFETMSDALGGAAEEAEADAG